MIGFGFIAAAAVGVWLLYEPRRRLVDSAQRPRASRRMSAAAARDMPVPVIRSALAGTVVAAAGWIGAWTLFGGVIVPALVAVLAGAAPPCAALGRQRHRATDSWRAWPRLLAEIRILVTHRGQSIPAALFAAGVHAPVRMREAFSEAERTWSLSTDFEASLRVLKTSLGDPTADAVCETLLAAHQIGGVQIDARLRALAEAAQAEAAARSDAKAKQAGARFARSFVALVPGFMAVIGLSIGRGRQAYETSQGQLLVALSVLAVAGCWLWAGRIMAVPIRKRVFVK